MLAHGNWRKGEWSAVRSGSVQLWTVERNGAYFASTPSLAAAQVLVGRFS